MKLEEAISKLRMMLSEAKTPTEAAVEVHFATAELVDGTIVKTEGEIEVGKTLYVETPEGEITAPQGLHETTEGLLVSVDEAGVILSIEPKTEEVIEVEEKAEFGADFLEQISSIISPLNEQISSLREQLTNLKGEFQAFREEPAGKKITNNIGENQRQVESMYEAKMRKILDMRNGKK